MKFKITLLLSAVTIIIFFFCGCSNDEDNNKEMSEKSSPIDFFIDWSPGPDYIGFYVSEENGYYAEEGININIRSGNGAEQAATLLKSDAIKIGTTTVDALIRQELQQKDLAGNSDLSMSDGSTLPPPKIAAIIFVTNPVVLITKKELPIYNFENLSGLKIGYSETTSVTYSQFKVLLDKNSTIAEKIDLVKVGWNGPQEFQAGTIDGLLAYATDVPPELKMQGIPFNMRRLSDFGMTVSGQCIAISPKAGIEIPNDIIQRFLRASIRGWEFARSNPEKAADLFVAKFPGQDPKKTLESIKYTVELLPPVFGDQFIDAYTSEENIRTQIENAINVLVNVIDAKSENDYKAEIMDSLVYVDMAK